MFSEMLVKLWNNGIIQKGVWETIYMTVLSSAISYCIGLPLGVILNITDSKGLQPMPMLNRILGHVVNFFRSIPFIILMVAMLPVAKLVVGVSLGNRAMIVMLVIAASPYVARMVESSLKEVDAGVIEAAQSMGTDNFHIIGGAVHHRRRNIATIAAIYHNINQMAIAFVNQFGVGGIFHNLIIVFHRGGQNGMTEY